jgi:RNA polymerase sigma factor (sigma-70 family)
MHRLLRDLSPRALAAVLRRYRDFPAAEDAVQEALLAATTHWPVEGTPDNPLGWLVRVASRRIADHARADAARRHREALVVSLVPADEQIALAADALHREGDDTLELLFLCCHPSLTSASAIALTLRAVGGLTTPEIARAFLVPEATMAQRISRAKQTVKSSGVPFEALSEAERVARLRTVMQVLYLLFNEGYTASAGPTLARADLSDEAIRLTRMLHALVPDDPEVTGLLALMRLTDARRAARTTDDGALVPLDQQDRSRWDRAAIAEGIALVEAALAKGAAGPYQVQAAIAALHDEGRDTEGTDWPQIAALYGLLVRMTDNPVARLNRAVAVAMVKGPAAGLALLDEAANDPRLADHHRVHAARAHLLERAGDTARAEDGYLRAAERTDSLAERDYLRMRAARLREGG